MFQFPEFARTGLCIHPAVTPSGCPVTPGYPIRKSPDQHLFDGSPELIAACHVLHRLSTPRHPPCTLTSLTTLMKRSRSSFLRRFDCTFWPAKAGKPVQRHGSDRHYTQSHVPEKRKHTCDQVASLYSLVKELGDAHVRPKSTDRKPPLSRQLSPRASEHG